MKRDDMEAKDRSNACSRREFLGRGSGIVAAATLGLSLRLEAGEETSTPELPKKTLGRTGVKVPILGLGTALLGHQNGNRPDIKKLVAIFGDAIDRGITYVDTGRIYGGAEQALSKVLATRRDKIFLATKVWAEDAEKAEKSFHESLKVMNVDHVDVLHLHSAGNKNMDKVLGNAGSWEFIQRAKKEGKARFIGVSGHSRPANFVRLLETDTVDVMMVAMNFVDRYVYGFEEKVLPVARKHRTGVMAMKVYGGVVGGFRNYSKREPHPSQMAAEHHELSIRYIKSLEGVTGMVIGVHTAEQVRKNLQRVLDAKPLSKDEFAKTRELGKKIAQSWTPRFGPVI